MQPRTTSAQNPYWNTLVRTPLRHYQARICDGARDKNAIVVLPTGAGKTLIAATLTSHYHSSTQQRGKTLFFVPTQMLAAQQARAVETNTKLRVKMYHGELSWPKSTAEYDVLVSTPEAFRLKLACNQASFQTFTLIVFDEVHHVNKKHPYRKIARLLELERPKPLVLGLTATCTYAVAQSQIASDITKLCEALQIESILSATQDELIADGYHGSTARLEMHTDTNNTTTTTTTTSGSSSGSNNNNNNNNNNNSNNNNNDNNNNNNSSADEDVDIYDVFEDDSAKSHGQFMAHQSREAFFHSIETRTGDPLLLRIVALTYAVGRLVSASSRSFVSPLNAPGKMGKVAEWSAYASKHPSTLANTVLLHLYEALRLMVVTWSTALDLVLEYLRMTMKGDQLRLLGDLAPSLTAILDDGEKSAGVARRLKRLHDVMMKQHDTHEREGKFRGILFVQQRLTTHILQHFIERSPGLRERFKCACIYATGSEASPTFRVTPSQSKDRIALFAEGKVNLLISTSVAEEGMDVPAANCIIRFDPILTPVSLVQGRGRARQKESTFVVMDERKDRTVQQLGVAEGAQTNILQNHSAAIISISQSEDAKRRRVQAQDSRERSARDYLRTAQGNPVMVLHQFCQKSDRELLEVVKEQRGSGWTAVVSVLGCGGEKMVEEVTAGSKQQAKMTASANLLAKIRAQ